MPGMVSHPVETVGSPRHPFKQWLRGFAGVPVTASEVKVYRVKRNGDEKLIRIEPPTFFGQVKNRRITNGNHERQI